ncbi:MAG TPA: NAD-dependent epimerase/dehydratase family protein [Nevskiaceae bacterium]|nr:NAD-dependent epimerase/dehydratase family protein [Nevskiaceae bacterium]
MARTALVAGPTGLVGRMLVDRLLANPEYTRVSVLTRRPIGRSDPKLVEVQTDFTALEKIGDKLAADDVFCCLGTTLAKAGSRAAFERVDYHMVVDLARATKAAGAKQFLVVSAVGAAPTFPAPFYSRVKARMEQAVAEIGFDGVQIVRPSLLLGAREDRRIAEDIAQRVAPILAPLFIGPLKKYRPVPAGEVAAALEQLASRHEQAVRVHHLPLDA